MRATTLCALTLALLANGGAIAADETLNGRRASRPDRPDWQGAITVYPTSVRDAPNYAPAIAVANRGALHLEARYSYEWVASRSAFAGWTFSGGEAISWELTPMLGGAWGSSNAFVPAFEASIGWKRLDFYIEGEYVRDRAGRSDSYSYAWSELGLRPLDGLRIGLATQRTRAYGAQRDVQRGPFAQASWGRVTIGGYWFNPGSNAQVLVGSIGVSF